MLIAIEGVVRGPDGEPVSGSQVALTPAQGPGAESMISDEAGRFRFDALDPRRYTVSAHSARGASTLVHVDAGRGTRFVELTLREGIVLEVKVVDGDGRPVSTPRGVAVSRSPSGARWTRLEVTGDEQGRIRFPALPAGVLEVTASAAEYAPTTEVLPFGGVERLDRSLEIVLEPGTLLSGIVLDERGEPVAGAEISERPGHPPHTRMSYRDRPASGLRPATFTDREGRFGYPARTGQRLQLLVHASGYLPWRSPDLVADAPQTLDVRLQPGRRVRGIVVDRNGGPVARARVVEHDRNMAETAEDGTFSLILAEDSDAPALIHAETARARSDLLAVPDDQEVRIVLAHELGIQGVVIGGDQRPVADAVVSYRMQDSGDPEPRRLTRIQGEVVTGADGEFQIPGLAEGAYDLFCHVVDAADRVGIPRYSQVTASPGVDVVITLPLAPTVRGRVRLADGTPVRRFTIGTGGVLPGGPPHEFDTTDGTFVLVVPAAPLTATLSVTADAMQPIVIQRMIAPGASSDLGDLILHPGREIRGVLRSAETGGPIASGRVEVKCGESETIAYTSPTGTFRVMTTSDCDVSVRAGFAGVGASRTHHVPRGPRAADVALVLPETGRVEITVTNYADDMVAMAFGLDPAPGDFLGWELEARGDGRFGADLSPGPYRLHVVRRAYDAVDTDYAAPSESDRLIEAVPNEVVRVSTTWAPPAP